MDVVMSSGRTKTVLFDSHDANTPSMNTIFSKVVVIVKLIGEKVLKKYSFEVHFMTNNVESDSSRYF